jgi:hypothetical protein
MTAPICVSHCADCGVGTITLGEWYMVVDEGGYVRLNANEPLSIVQNLTTKGRTQRETADILGVSVATVNADVQKLTKSEKRGRTLMACDFYDLSVNNPNEHRMSARLRDRITARGQDVFDWMVWGAP